MFKLEYSFCILFHHFSCLYCSDYYWDIRELNKHRSMHTDVEYKCELCELVFLHKNLFYAHVSAHHSTKKRKEKEVESNEQFLCELCNKNFKNKGSIRNHMVLHTSEESSTYCLNILFASCNFKSVFFRKI